MYKLHISTCAQEMCTNCVSAHAHKKIDAVIFPGQRNERELAEGRVAHSFLKTNYNLVGRRLGHGRMQMKWYIIQGKMLPRVTILVTQIKTESSRK